MKNIGFFVEETQIPFMLLEELFDDDTFAIIFRGHVITEPKLLLPITSLSDGSFQ